MKAHSDKGNCPEIFIGRILPPIKISNPTLPLSEKNAQQKYLRRMANLYSVYHTFLFLAILDLPRSKFLLAVIVVPSTFSTVLLDGIIYRQPKKGSVARRPKGDYHCKSGRLDLVTTVRQ